jgi:hypothetical protein
VKSKGRAKVDEKKLSDTMNKAKSNLFFVFVSRPCTRPVSRKPAFLKKIWPREIAGLVTGLEWLGGCIERKFFINPKFLLL